MSLAFFLQSVVILICKLSENHANCKTSALQNWKLFMCCTISFHFDSTLFTYAKKDHEKALKMCSFSFSF